MVAAMANPAQAQGFNGNSFQNWNFLGSGARAHGMGGAFLGISDDGTAGSWNPAGLIYNEGVLLTLNYAYAHTSLTSDYGLAGSPATPYSPSANLSGLTSASFVSPLTVMGKELMVSVYYNRVQQLYGKARVAADQDPVLGAPFTAQYSIDGNLAQAGLAVGATVARHLSLGFSMALMTGDGTEFSQTDIDSTRDTVSYNQHMSWIDKSDLGYSGINFNFAALYKAERWSAGLVVSPGYTLKQSLDYRALRFSEHNGISAYSPVVYAPLHGTKREIDIPYTVGLGGAYHLKPNLILAADFQYRAFNSDKRLENNGSSRYRFQSSPTEPDSKYESVPVSWYNLHQFRLGVEYKRETSIGTVPIRAGVRNEPMLVGDPTGTSLLFDQRLDSGRVAEFPLYSLRSTPQGTGNQVWGWTFSVGSGLHWSQIHLDAAVEFTSWNYAESGSIYSIQRCPNCLDTDPGVTNDAWGKRRLQYWGDYFRSNDQSIVRLLVNFTGYF
jgi:hypothetical protein